MYLLVLSTLHLDGTVQALNPAVEFAALRCQQQVTRGVQTHARHTSLETQSQVHNTLRAMARS